MGSCRISQGVKGVKSTRNTEYCVIIDVLRASSTVVTALARGFQEVRTVTTIRDALGLRKKGYILAGERKGITLPGFDLGNSPSEILYRGAAFFKDKTVVQRAILVDDVFYTL